MNVDLRELLRERSAIEDSAIGADRVASVHQRIGVVRRRRAAGAVAGVVVAVAGVAAGWALLPARLTSAPPTPPAVSPTAENGFPEYMVGARVIATAVAELPQTSVSVTIVPETLDLALAWWCTPAMWSEVSWDDSGHYIGSTCHDQPAASVFPAGAQTWAERGFVVGQPATITLTVTHVNGYTDAGPVERPLPESGTLALAILQRLPFAEYPLPSPPATLAPLEPDEESGPRRVLVTADDADPLASGSATFAWSQRLQLVASSQTPGYLHIEVNGVPLPTLEWWDYQATGRITPLDDWPDLNIDDGTVVTLTVTPEHVTGDWFVAVIEGPA